MFANTISLFNVYFSHKPCYRKHLNLKKGDEPFLWHFCPNFSSKNNSHEVLSAYIKMKELRLRTHSPKEMGLFVTSMSSFAGPAPSVPRAQVCIQKPSQVISS